jgi:hypothetical protein
MRFLTKYSCSAIAVLLTVFLFWGCSNDNGVQANVEPESGSVTVLFIGNSLTFYNDLPGMLEKLATANGKKVYVGKALVGGASLEDHCNSETTISKIYAYDWDYVVLQGSSYHIAFPSQHYLILPYIERLDSMIHDNCPTTKTIFFMDWAMKDGVYWNGQTYSYDDFQQRIASGTKIMADQLDMIIAPIGWAFKSVIDDRDDIELFHYDKAHPSREGSYLGACVYFSTIFKKAVEYSYIDPYLAASLTNYLREKASSVVMDELGRWNNAK